MVVHKPKFYICNAPFLWNAERGLYESEDQPHLTLAPERVDSENMPVFSFKVVKINGDPYFKVSALGEYWIMKRGSCEILSEKECSRMAQTQANYRFEVPDGRELRRMVALYRNDPRALFGNDHELDRG